MHNKTKGTKTTYTKPLKEQPPERFWEIIEQVRIDYMRRLGIHINTPAEHYKLSEQAYDLWKLGKINFGQARRLTSGEFEPEPLSAN